MKLKNILITGIIALIISCVWMGLELILYKEIQARRVDDIICLIYMPFIYYATMYFTDN